MYSLITTAAISGLMLFLDEMLGYLLINEGLVYFEVMSELLSSVMFCFLVLKSELLNS